MQYWCHGISVRNSPFHGYRVFVRIRILWWEYRRILLTVNSTLSSVEVYMLSTPPTIKTSGPDYFDLTKAKDPFQKDPIYSYNGTMVC